MYQWAETPEKEFGKFKRVSGLYASCGDHVTCENGHLICEFVRDVYVGEMFDPHALGNWQQREPAIGTLIQPCEACNARWYKGTYFHLEDGWRIA